MKKQRIFILVTIFFSLALFSSHWQEEVEKKAPLKPKDSGDLFVVYTDARNTQLVSILKGIIEMGNEQIAHTAELKVWPRNKAEWDIYNLNLGDLAANYNFISRRVASANLIKVISEIEALQFAVIEDDIFVRESKQVRIIDTKTDSLKAYLLNFEAESIAAVNGKVFLPTQSRAPRGFIPGTAKLVVIDAVDFSLSEVPIYDYPSAVAILDDKVVVVHRPYEVGSFGGVHLSFFDPKKNSVVAGPMPVDLQNSNDLVNLNGRLFIGTNGGHYNKIASVNGRIAFSQNSAPIDSRITLRSHLLNKFIGVNNKLIAYSEFNDDRQLHIIDAENPGVIEKSISFDEPIRALTSYEGMLFLALSDSKNTVSSYHLVALNPMTLGQVLLADHVQGHARMLEVVNNKIYVGTADSIQVFDIIR